jgi:hypothetical protein
MYKQCVAACAVAVPGVTIAGLLLAQAPGQGPGG